MTRAVTPVADPQDFTSATMVRLVSAGLKRQGLGEVVTPPTGARVPLSRKRELLDAVLRQHGPLAILSIADAAPELPPEPVVQALSQARSIDDLLQRWQRLERFSHSRHRVEIRRIDVETVGLLHRSRDETRPPSTAESLLVLGLLTVLAEMTGAREVTLTATTGEVWRQNSQWRACDMRQVKAGLMLSGRDAVLPGPAPAPASDDGLETRLRARIAEDPVRRWTVKDAARDLAMSTRTLQRRLAERGASFSRVVSEARLEVAARHLCDPDGPALAAIGFLSGYSDHAHFTRSFRQAVGIPPKSYRADFRAGSPDRR